MALPQENHRGGFAQRGDERKDKPERGIRNARERDRHDYCGCGKSHKKQILTHLRLAHRKLGFLLNFGAAVMKEGITRTVNGLDAGR